MYQESLKNVKGDISFWGGISAHSFITLNGSPMQNRALKTSENDGEFCNCSCLTFHDCSQVHFWPFQACHPEICMGPFEILLNFWTEEQ